MRSLWESKRGGSGEWGRKEVDIQTLRSVRRHGELLASLFNITEHFVTRPQGGHDQNPPGSEVPIGSRDVVRKGFREKMTQN